ncbi:MAG: pyridoxal phosphate-dependent aminotransferase [Treponema sp.]|nr:pyridoxal phosphate-dependent aminotransferase [Treponema sp.]
MPIAYAIKEALSSSSMIRRMFEEGNQLKAQYGADNVFDFSIGNPDIDPPPAFHQIFVKLAQDDLKGSHGYMANAGYRDVRAALAQKVNTEHGVTVDYTHIIMAVGASGGLNVVLKSILNPGDEVLVPCPYFVEYRSYINNHGGVFVPVETLTDFNLDISAIAEKLSSKTAAVLINSPHNPTGRVYPAHTINALAEALNMHGNTCGRFPYLIVDEPYRELVYGGIPVAPILSAYNESIVVNSYSKSLSIPGERIGYVAVSPHASDKQLLLDALIHATRVLGFTNAPALMQRIVAQLTTVKVDISVYERRLAVFRSILDQVGIRYANPEGTFYLFCHVPEGCNDIQFIEHLKNYLILGVPGSGFGKANWVRFAYCVNESIIAASAQAFKKAMQRFLKST